MLHSCIGFCMVPLMQYHDTKKCLVLGHLVTSAALEFCLLPNGDLCYFSCKVFVNSECRRGSSSVIENVWSPHSVY